MSLRYCLGGSSQSTKPSGKPHELSSKLPKGGYIGDYNGVVFQAYEGGCQELTCVSFTQMVFSHAIIQSLDLKEASSTGKDQIPKPQS